MANRLSVNGRDIIPGTLPPEAFETPNDGKHGLSIQTTKSHEKDAHENERVARIVWDATANQLQVICAGTTWTFAPEP